MTPASFWQYKSSDDIRRYFLQERRQTGVVLKSTNLPFSRCYIFVSFRNNVGINLIAHYDDTPFWIFAGVGTNKDDIE